MLCFCKIWSIQRGALMKKFAFAAAALILGTAWCILPRIWPPGPIPKLPWPLPPSTTGPASTWVRRSVMLGVTTGRRSATLTATGLPSGFNQNYTSVFFVGGAHAGYNWQFGQFVFGLEGDIEGADIKGGYRLANTNGTNFLTDAQASIRGRLGVAFNNSLLYVTGGAASSPISNTPTSQQTPSLRVSPAPAPAGPSGAGWEYGFTPQLVGSS